MTLSDSASTASEKKTRRRMILGGIAVVLLGAVALDTKVVQVGSDEDFRQQAFDPDRFGTSEFPRIRDFVTGKAPDGPVLAEAIAADKKTAITEYGTQAGAFAVMPVTVTGTVGEGKSGVFNLDVDGLPDGVGVRVQTGPAINGTELRDVVGDIEFGAFKNQIEYQDAGAGINRAMSAEVLGDLDRESLTGKTMTVTGVFTLINPKNWLITPVALEVSQ